MPVLQLAIGILWAVSSGFGFDSGVGVDASLEGEYFEISASATTEHKPGYDGYTWGGEALVLYPISSLRLFGGVSVYGYKADWEKSATAPTFGVEYVKPDIRLRLQHQVENEYDTSLTSLSFEYAMSPRWWYGCGVGVSDGRTVGDIRLTFRP